MNLAQIEQDMDEALSVPVNDKCKKLFSHLSEDEAVRAIARLRKICGKLKLYCQFFKAKTFEHPNGKPIREQEYTGRLVKVRPCAEKYENKTYLGVLVGDAALSSSISMSKDSIVCEWTFFNPAILVPDLNKIIYGCESWWSILGDEELTQITDSDIENVWYVKLAKSLAHPTQEP